MHSLLTRQLKKAGIQPDQPPSSEHWRIILERVNRTYTDTDQDRYLLERSLTTMSNEMLELYEALKRTSDTRIAAERNKLRAIISSLGAGLLLFGPDLRVTSLNPHGERLMGCTEAQLIGRALTDIVLRQPDAYAQLQLDTSSLLCMAVTGRSHAEEDTTFLRVDGSSFPASYVLTPLVENDTLTGVVLVFSDATERKRVEAALRKAHDELEARVRERTAELARLNDGLQIEITERRRAEEILRRSEARFRSLVQNGSDVIAILDEHGLLRYASPSLERVLGYRPELWIGRSPFDLVHPADAARVIRAALRAREEPGSYPPMEFRLQHADGTWRHVETTATNLLNDPSVCGIVQNMHDITERKRLEEQLTYQAFRDSLTGLPNRALFRERLRFASERSTGRGERIGLLFIDLDHFKCINDSLGHDVGDRLLRAVAERLQDNIRPGDTVARLGGDEFTILLEEIQDESELVRLAERIAEKLQHPFELEGHEVVVTASIGLSLTGRRQSSAEDLVREADIAMYAAKARGRSRHEIYKPGMDSDSLERLELEADLRRAIRDGELRVHYQPLVELRTGRIAEVEALVRWQHGRKGMLAPARFIPMAEQSGLIIPLGEWVLKEACRQTRAWHLKYPDGPMLEISVNLSARQLSHGNLTRVVAHALESTGLEPTCLKLEITESAAMEDAAAAIATMKELKELGVQLVIDDFGTGYSSLSYLKRFPVDTLKIDRSFVDGLGEGLAGDTEDAAIARAIVALARSLNLSVTAEGIETVDQLHALQALGCDHGQGYLFSRPVEPEALEGLLSSPGPFARYFEREEAGEVAMAVGI